MTPERFMQRVSPEPNSGCWIWMGALGRLLYGKATHEGKDIGAQSSSVLGRGAGQERKNCPGCNLTPPGA